MKKGRRKKLKLIHVILGALAVYIGVIFWNQRILLKDLESKKDAISQEVRTLERDIENLNREIEESDSLLFVEKVARDDLGMVKPREIIYVDKDKKKNHFFNVIKKDN